MDKQMHERPEWQRYLLDHPLNWEQYQLVCIAIEEEGSQRQQQDGEKDADYVEDCLQCIRCIPRLTHGAHEQSASLAADVVPHQVLFGMQNRTFGPCFAAIHRILLSLVVTCSRDSHCTSNMASL
jgi:hypothetical protein